MNRRRDLLHRSKLHDFVSWAKEQGCVEQPVNANHGYEVARLAHAQLREPIIIHSRDTGEHLTITAQGTQLVRRWLRSRRAALAKEQQDA